MRVFILAMAVAVLGACGPAVTPIDLHDLRLSPESRSFMADTEDAVSIARARLDDRQFALEKLSAEVLAMKGEGWPKDPGAKALWDQWMTSRVALATQRRDLARASLTQASSRHQLTVAQTALRHDLAVYELEPLKEEVTKAQAKVEALRREVLVSRGEVASLADQWWTSWGQLSRDKGQMDPLFLTP